MTQLNFKVQSADGIVWKQAQYDVFLRLPFGASTSIPTSYRGFLDNDGAATVDIADTDNPAWFLTVVPHLDADVIPDAHVFEYTQPISVTGGSVTVTPPAFPFVAK